MTFRVLGSKPGTRCLSSVLAEKLLTKVEAKTFAKTYISKHYPRYLYMEQVSPDNIIFYRILGDNPNQDEYVIKVLEDKS